MRECVRPWLSEAEERRGARSSSPSCAPTAPCCALWESDKSEKLSAASAHEGLPDEELGVHDSRRRDRSPCNSPQSIMSAAAGSRQAHERTIRTTNSSVETGMIAHRHLWTSALVRPVVSRASSFDRDVLEPFYATAPLS